MLELMGKYGRLGNQLWTYANVLAFALDNKIPLINSAFDEQKWFNGVNGLSEANNSLKRYIYQHAVLKK